MCVHLGEMRFAPGHRKRKNENNNGAEHLPGGPAPKTGPASRITGSTARRCRFEREINETTNAHRA